MQPEAASIPASNANRIYASTGFGFKVEQGFSGVGAEKCHARFAKILGGVKTIPLDLQTSDQFQYWNIRCIRRLAVFNKTPAFPEIFQ